MRSHFDSRWADEILAMSTDELAERNGAHLLASQLHTQVQGRRADLAAYHEDLAAYRRAHQAGLAAYRLAMEAKRTGRKTLLVDAILALIEGGS